MIRGGILVVKLRFSPIRLYTNGEIPIKMKRVLFLARLVD